MARGNEIDRKVSAAAAEDGKTFETTGFGRRRRKALGAFFRWIGLRLRWPLGRQPRPSREARDTTTGPKPSTP